MSNFPQIVTVPTDLGDAEANKDAQGDYWQINYPWGGDRYYGTKTQVKSRMGKAITSYEKIEACENVGNHRDGWSCPKKCGAE